MEASSAYEVLSNEDKRQVYDREGEEVRPRHDVLLGSPGAFEAYIMLIVSFVGNP
jgi:DnaJ-class molecular chaperone